MKNSITTNKNMIPQFKLNETTTIIALGILSTTYLISQYLAIKNRYTFNVGIVSMSSTVQ